MYDVAQALKVDPLALAVGDSVDFRLVFSVSPDVADMLRQEFHQRDWSLFEIGKLTEAQAAPTVYLETERGLEPVPGVEWAQSDMMSIDQLRNTTQVTEKGKN